ncbi:MAG: glycosyltransferase [Bacteroidales bacterium]|jgi:glycosyltransferase involved in cell wall biosynthesis|nr:glycosyltransferase [Bacteroidales bacterium]
MNWYHKYVQALGDFTRLPDDVFTQIGNNLKRMERGDHIDVSFIFIACNEESRLLPSVWSVSEMQTDLSVEVIVVNNASTDRTQEMIDRMGVHTVFQPKPGHGNARQAGLDMARGKYHLSADADTLYPPAYVDEMVRRLSQPGVAVVFAPYGFFSDKTATSTLSLKIYELCRDGVIALRARKRPELCAGGAAMACYTEQMKQVGWRADLRRGEDGSMLLALKKYGKAVLVLSRKARVKSSSRRLDADGSFLKMVVQRIRREIRGFSHFFTKQRHYADKLSNLK